LVQGQQLAGAENFAIVALVGDALNRGQPDFHTTPCGSCIERRGADDFAPAFDETRLLSWFACATALSAREVLQFRNGRVFLRGCRLRVVLALHLYFPNALPVPTAIPPRQPDRAERLVTARFSVTPVLRVGVSLIADVNRSTPATSANNLKRQGYRATEQCRPRKMKPAVRIRTAFHRACDARQSAGVSPPLFRSCN